MRLEIAMLRLLCRAQFQMCKLKILDKEKVAIAVSGKARPNGELYNPEDEPKKHTTGMLYDSLMVRHWDKYVTPNRNAIWHGILHQAKPHITESKGRYGLGNLTNVLKGSRLESPIPPWGGQDNFDLSATGVGFVAKDPDLNPATNTKSNFYYVNVDYSPNGPTYSEPVKLEIQGLEGASTAPTFSPSGKGVVFLQMKENGYESDKNRIIVDFDVGNPATTAKLLEPDDQKRSWDRSPSSVTWSNDEKTLFLIAEDKGVTRLFQLQIPVDSGVSTLPEPLTQSGTVSDIQSLGTNSSHLLLSGSSLIDDSFYSILDPAGPAEAKVVSSNSHNGSFFGLSQDQVSEIWFQGAKAQVHAWVMKPSNFSSDKKYPLAYLVHGGPQGAWTDSWSTRWNPAIFAEQGYVVVTPNPTGSTSYGQQFTDAINEEWGGLPYDDLVKGLRIHQRQLELRRH